MLKDIFLFFHNNLLYKTNTFIIEESADFNLTN